MARDPKKTVGGQAVIEGVMMRAPEGWAVAVRNPEGRIEARRGDLPRLSSRSVAARIPFVRGVGVLAESLSLGMRALSWSARVADEEEEELSSTAMALSIAVALAFAIGVFVLVPTFFAKWVAGGNDVVLAVVETVLRIGLFVGYVWAIGLWEDVARVYRYHGAEHKTIHAYEHGDPLSVAEVQKYSPAHPRCGTSFLLLVLLISSVLFGVLGDLAWLWLVVSRIVLIPVVAGISYEILRFSGLRDGWFADVIAAPGLWLQKLTTGEPDDGQVEVAIASLLTALDPEAREEALARGPVPEASLDVELH
ncbi:MAG: DUF1385 domain-containing protein [Acidimicrobiia bacterium]